MKDDIQKGKTQGWLLSLFFLLFHYPFLPQPRESDAVQAKTLPPANFNLPTLASVRHRPDHTPNTPTTQEPLFVSHRDHRQHLTHLTTRQARRTHFAAAARRRIGTLKHSATSSQSDASTTSHQLPTARSSPRPPPPPCPPAHHYQGLLRQHLDKPDASKPASAQGGDEREDHPTGVSDGAPPRSLHLPASPRRRLVRL